METTSALPAVIRSIVPPLGSFPFKRLMCAVSTAVGLVLPLGAASAVQAEPGTTNHLLAIGICPPWKSDPQKVCEDGVAAMTVALQARLGVADENTLTLLNADATAEGLRQGLEQLQGDLGPTDRLIIFANLHAGPLVPGTLAAPENAVFVLWTDEKPAAAPFALAKGDWITAKNFAGMIHDITAGEIF